MFACSIFIDMPMDICMYIHYVYIYIYMCVCVAQSVVRAGGDHAIRHRLRCRSPATPPRKRRPADVKTI